jgi:hypothetical protein
MWEPRAPLPEIPAPDPKRPWALTHNDRWFLKGLKIDPEHDRTPYPERDTEDGS